MGEYPSLNDRGQCPDPVARRPAYRAFHTRAWMEARRVLTQDVTLSPRHIPSSGPRGLFLVRAGSELRAEDEFRDDHVDRPSRKRSAPWADSVVSPYASISS